MSFVLIFRRPFPDTIRFAATATCKRVSGTNPETIARDLTRTLHVDSAQVKGPRADFTRPGDTVRVALPRNARDTIQVSGFYYGLPSTG